MLSLLCTSFWFVRRYFYNAFQKIHLVHALVALGGAGWHVFRRPASQAWVPVVLAASLLTLTTAFEWLRVFVYASSAAIHNEPIRASAAFRIDVRCKKPLRVFPGCYFQVFFPGKLFHWNMLQSYPMTVMWHSAEDRPDGSTSETASGTSTANQLSFLVSRHGRPIQNIRLKKGQQLLLSGPYGQDLHLHRFETIMLAAKGAGILGVLSIALHLSAPMHGVRGAKVNVFWSLDENSQEGWVADELRALQKSDVNNVSWPTLATFVLGLIGMQRVFMVWCLFPTQQAPRLFEESDYWCCFYGVDEKLFLHSMTDYCEGSSIVIGGFFSSKVLDITYSVDRDCSLWQCHIHLRGSSCCYIAHNIQAAHPVCRIAVPPLQNTKPFRCGRCGRRKGVTNYAGGEGGDE
jgi:hypothetical protein